MLDLFRNQGITDFYYHFLTNLSNQRLDIKVYIKSRTTYNEESLSKYEYIFENQDDNYYVLIKQILQISKILE